MDELLPTSKFELGRQIEDSWDELQILLGQLTEAQLANTRDKQGWLVKDHIAHMTAWERSVVYFLQGKPRYEGLGIDEELYHQNVDAVNARIQRNTATMTLPQVQAAFRDTHKELLDLLQPMSDADLQLPYRHYLPQEEPIGEDGPPAMKVIYDNTAGHYKEHIGWIKALVTVE